MIVANVTILTMGVLAVSELLLGLYFLGKAYRLKKKIRTQSFEDFSTLVQQIVINESQKIVIPLAYLACFSIAFIGPNADTLGNVQNGYWQFQAVEDLWTPVKNLLILVSIDSSITLFFGLFFYLVLEVNVIHVFLHICEEYGRIFTWQTAYILKYLFCWISIGCALDLTFQFDWLFDAENWKNMISNQTMF